MSRHGSSRKWVNTKYKPVSDGKIIIGSREVAVGPRFCNLPRKEQAKVVQELAEIFDAVMVAYIENGRIITEARFFYE